METILVPLHASEIALDPTGPDIAEFTVDAAVSQVWAILAALGDKAGDVLGTIRELGNDPGTQAGDDLGTRRPKLITFHPNGDVEADGKRSERMSQLQYDLLELIYKSKGYAVSFQRATELVWKDSLMDEDRIKKMMKRLNKSLVMAGIGIHVYQKKMTVVSENGTSESGLFICLSFVPKSSLRNP